MVIERRKEQLSVKQRAKIENKNWNDLMKPLIFIDS